MYPDFRCSGCRQYIAGGPHDKPPTCNICRDAEARRIRPYLFFIVGMVLLFSGLYAAELNRPARVETDDGLKGAYLKWERLKSRIEKVNPRINASEAADAIISAAENHPQNVYLLAAVFEVESRYNSLAVGDSGKARGMSQMHPTTAEDLKVSYENLKDPYVSADAGALYLARHLAAYSTIRGAVERYNGGGDPEYAQKVMARYLEITGGFQL